jgi:hypothetical protein
MRMVDLNGGHSVHLYTMARLVNFSDSYQSRMLYRGRSEGNPNLDREKIETLVDGRSYPRTIRGVDRVGMNRSVGKRSDRRQKLRDCW